MMLFKKLFLAQFTTKQNILKEYVAYQTYTKLQKIFETLHITSTRYLQQSKIVVLKNGELQGESIIPNKIYR